MGTRVNTGTETKGDYSERSIEDSCSSRSSHPNSHDLPPRPAAGPWRDPSRGHGMGKNPVMMIAKKPEPVFDRMGRPRMTGSGKRRRPAENQDLPHHGTPFATMHDTAWQLLKLLIAAREHEAARLLICDVEQLTYAGYEERSTAEGFARDENGNWQFTFEEWREIDDEHVVMTLPRRVVEIEDPSASQAAWRSVPERDKHIAALINAAELAGGTVDVDFLFDLYEQADEMSEQQHHRAREVLVQCGIERWNEYGKLEINAPLLMQGPAAMRMMFEHTLDPAAERPFIATHNEDPGTKSGRRNKVTTSDRQEQDIERLTSQRDEAEADRDATLRRGIGLVEERNSLRSEFSLLIDQMQQLINDGRALLANPEMSDAQVRQAMQQVFRSDDTPQSGAAIKEASA